MKIIDKLRLRTAKKKLIIELEHLHRDAKSTNFDEIKSVGLLYYLPDEETYKTVESFVEKLNSHKIKTRVVAFHDGKIKPHYFIPKLQQDIITQKSTGFNLKPTGIFVNDFINEPFDLLIDLSLNCHYPLLHLAAMSKAHMKVGRHTDLHEKIFDFMFTVNENISLSEYIELLIHYLKKIN